MPIEIRELLIKTTLHERPDAGAEDARNRAAEPRGISRKEKAEIIAECMKQMRHLVKHKYER